MGSMLASLMYPWIKKLPKKKINGGGNNENKKYMYDVSEEFKK